MKKDKHKKDELIRSAEQATEDVRISEDMQTAETDANHSGTPKKRGKKTKIAVAVILSVLVLLVGGGIFIINKVLDKLNRPDPATDTVLSPSEIERLESEYWASVNSKENDKTTTAPDITNPESESAQTEEPTEAPTEERVVRAPFQADAYRATLSADDEPILFDHPVSYSWMRAADLNDDKLINIMLVGQDTRITDVRERSDSMILVSINPSTHKVSMISFMRDLYVPIGDGYGMGRLNTAYKIGGFPFMYKVFEEDYGIHIDGGICVNFGQFMTLVDILGGLDVTLNETEAKWLRYTIEQSIPDMRYWGQIVEAQMPTIKEGTSVKDAIDALKKANLNYAFSDMNGGAAPDDLAGAKVKSLWSDASCTTAARAGRYYNLQQTIYISYTETRAVFPKLAEDISVSSAISLLKDLGFTTNYADIVGGVAPEDGKAALITQVRLDAEGENIPAAGTKYKKGTAVYIAYMENKACVPKMAKDITIKEAEALLKAAGLRISWADSCGGVAPSDKSKATLTGIYLDRNGKNQVKAGDKLEINTRIYLSYKDNTATMPTIAANTSVKDAEATLKAAGFKIAYATANKSKAPADKSVAIVRKITTDAAGTRTVKAGTKYDLNTTLYLTYREPEPTTEAPTTEAPTTAHEHNFNIVPAEWQFDERDHYRFLKCSCGEEVEERASHILVDEVVLPTTEAGGYTKHSCTICGYSFIDSYTDPLPTETEPSTEESSLIDTSTEEPTTEESTTTTESQEIEPVDPTVDSSETDAARSLESLTAIPEESLEYAAEDAMAETLIMPADEQAEAKAKTLYNPVLLGKRLSAATVYEPEYLRGIQAGRVHLNGMQTLAYCRMRKLDSDFKRTERQRMVLNTLFSKVKSSDMNTLKRLLDELLPQVTTDMTNSQIMSIAVQVLPSFSSIQISSYSVPINGSWRNVTINGAAVIQSDQEANIEAIRSWLPY